MIDPVAAGMSAVIAQSPAALGLVFIAGTVTSIGPCVAPRYIAIAAIAQGYRHPIVPTLAFVCGLVGAFMGLGFGAGVLGSVWTYSALLYALLAGCLLAGGSFTLVRAVPHHDTAATCDHRHTPIGSAGRHRSLGAIFLLGATSALMVSPCCTPVVASIAATTAAIGKPLLGMLLLAVFAVGHALPLLCAGSAASIVRRTLRLRGTEQASAIVSGVLMLALGAYYGVLA